MANILICLVVLAIFVYLAIWVLGMVAGALMLPGTIVTLIRILIIVVGIVTAVRIVQGTTTFRI